MKTFICVNCEQKYSLKKNHECETSGGVMPKKKYECLISINVTTDQKYALDQLGGPTDGFRKLYAFWYANYAIWEEQEKKRKRIEEKINGLK